MATYWKEVVNFGGGYSDVKLSLCVADGKGVCVLDFGFSQDGRISLLTREGEVTHHFRFGKCEFSFETKSREYCVRIFEGEKLLCFGGNSKNLRYENSIPKITATDTFEESVANFNYFETELGEKGKNLDSILGEETEKIQNESVKVAKIAEKIQEKVVVEEVKVEFTTNKEAEEVKKEAVEEVKIETPKVETSKPKKTKPQSKTQSQPKTQPQGKQKSKSGEGDFLSLAKPQVERMLAKFPKEEFLEEVLDNSKWARVEFSKGVSYAVGLIYADDMVGYIGYALPGKFDSPPQFENPQFVPLDISNPNGEGYFLIFQRADNGEMV